jgi:hypothetical protein
MQEGMDKEEAIKDLAEKDLGVNAVLPTACWWPVSSGRRGVYLQGLPKLDICMIVDRQGMFDRERSIIAFKGNFGTMPARASILMSRLMCVDEEMDDNPKSIDNFLPPPKILDDYTRMTTFTIGPENMSAFYMANHFSEQNLRILKYLHMDIPDPETRVHLYSKYLRDSLRFHRSIVMNGNLQNIHAEAVLNYITMSGPRINTGLSALRDNLFQADALNHTSDGLRNAPFLGDVGSHTFWRLQSLDSFVFYSWEFQQMYTRFNLEFCHLTPPNFYTFIEVNLV